MSNARTHLQLVIGALCALLISVLDPATAVGAVPFLAAGATVSTTDLDAALKIIFDEPLVNNVVMDTELLKYFPNGSGIQMDRTTGGRYIETAQMFNLPAGFGFRSEGDYIPVPSGPTIANSRINLKKALGAVEINSEVLKQVRSDEGAYLNWAERHLPALVERATNEIDRITLGYGSGVKARVNAAVPATDLVVDSPMGYAVPNQNVRDALFHFLAGETLIASPNIDGTSPRAGVMKVNNVDFANGHIEVDALAAGLADDDYLFAGDAAGNSAGKEAMGLLGMVDDGTVLATFQNIARATYAAWNGLVLDAAAAPFAAGQTLTERVIMYADDEVYQTGGGRMDLFLCSRQGARQYWASLVGDRSINDPRGSMTGGIGPMFVQLGDRRIPLRTPRKMPGVMAYGLQLSTFKKFVLHEWQWDDQAGGSIWKQVTDGTGRKDAYWAYGGLYYELACTDPQKNVRIENLKDAAFV